MDALVEVRVQQRLSMPALCELYFALAPEHAGLDAAFSPGATLEVRLAGQAQHIFAGEITAVEYFFGAQEQREVVVRGYDLLHRMRRRQTVRAFSNTGLQNIAKQLAGEAGISKVITSSGSGYYPYVIQHQQNDLEFLVELAAGAGQYLTMRSGVLYLLNLSGMEGSTPVELSYGDTLLEARLEVNADRVVPAARSYGWNAASLELQQGASRMAQPVFKGFPTGEAMRHAAEVLLLNQAAAHNQQAIELARAEVEHRAASVTSLWGRALGNPGLSPGASVKVSNVHKPLEGSYVITSAIHSFDTGSGYITEINTSPPELPVRSRSDTATIGVVTQVDDPSGLARLRAALPGYGNVETDWMQVVFPGAGPGKGLITMPDIGDTVLVLLTREDPARGLVLGGLYGTRRSPDSGVAHDAVKRFNWITPGGQKIQLNDDGKIIRLENGEGSYIELAGGDITIAGQAIDFKKI
jgi:phage protein D